MKKIVSILLAMLMVISIVPMASAAKLDSGLTVTTEGVVYQESTDGTKTGTVDLFANGFYGRHFEVGSSAGTSGLAGFREEFAKVTEGATIEYKWDQKQNVKRLELWIYPAGSIKNYTLKFWDEDADDWSSEVVEGTFEKGSINVTNDNYPNFAPIVLDSGKETSKILFTVGEIDQDVIAAEREANTKITVEGAYISQMNVYDSNEINLIGMKTLPNEFFPESVYAKGYYCSNSNGASDVVYGMTNECIWPFSTDGKQTALISPSTVTAGTAWYSTIFYGSKIKVNRAEIYIDRGSATGIEVWSSNAASVADAGLSTSASECPTDAKPSAWKLEKKISGTFGEGKVNIDIPDATASTIWLIKATGCTDNFRIYNDRDATEGYMTGFYTLSDSELGLSPKEASLTGNVTAGEKVTFTYSKDMTVNENAKVFFALYNGTELVSVTPVACALDGKYGNATATYTVPVDKGSNLSICAFFLDGSNLVPLLPSPVTK